MTLRCVICDYTEAHGSGYANANPGAHGRVRIHRDEPICDECMSAIVENFISLTETESDEVGENAPAVPLWEVE